MILQPYGMTIAIAILIGAYVASRLASTSEAKSRRARQAGQVWEALPWVLVFGLLGARAYHIVHLWEFYRENLVQVLFIWNGGLAIFGGIFGGLIGILAYVVLHANRSESKRMLFDLLDTAAPGAAIGQAIGRFANFFSQELYGWPTKMPWGIYIAPENRFPGLENFEYFHPLFLYEALWSFLNFVVLIKMLRVRPLAKWLLTGEMFLFYISFYALGRFFLEGLRIESWMVGGARVAQILSILILFGSITLAVARRMRSKKTENREQKTDTR